MRLPVQIAVLTNTVLVRNRIQPLVLTAKLVERVQEALQLVVSALRVKLKIQRPWGTDAMIAKKANIVDPRIALPSVLHAPLVHILPLQAQSALAVS